MGLRGGGGGCTQMLLLSWQLAASIDFSPFKEIHQSRCVGPPCLFLHQQRVEECVQEPTSKPLMSPEISTTRAQWIC